MTKIYDRPEVCRTYFFPQPDRPLPAEDKAGPLELRLPDGTRVGGYWSCPLAGEPTILYLHGNGECIADQIGHWPEWARRAGANIFFVDYPGYASSDGEPTFTSCCRAAMAALEHLLEQPEREVPAVVLMGRSVGSIFALDAAARTSSPKLHGLVLESGIADLKPRIDMRVPYEQVGLDRRAVHAELDQDFDHEGKMRSLRCPVLILHTRHDSLVPSWNSQKLAEWAGDKLHHLVLFDEGDHNDIQWTNAGAYQDRLAEFLGTLSSATVLSSMAAVEQDGLTMPTGFEEIRAAWTWHPIRGCPGRFVLRCLPDLTLEDLGVTDIHRFRVDRARDLVLVAAVRGGGLISYARPDGTYVHTLNSEDGFRRKLEQLGISWPSNSRASPSSASDRRPCRVLFVCQGNICRSPMAAAMAQAMYGDQVAAESAGLNPVYDTATSEAVQVMREQGLDISAHRSRNVRDLDLEPFDLIVALTPSIAARLPPVDRLERVVVWDIADPYGGDLVVYRSCAAAIKEKLKTLRIDGGETHPHSAGHRER